MAVMSDEIVVSSNIQTVRRRTSPAFDRGFRFASYGSALVVLAVLAGIIGTMIYGGWPAFQEFGFGFITSSVWNVGADQYGAWVAITGTLTSALIALVIGVPVSIGIAIFLTQLCPPWLRRPVSTTIELLAAVPSIIYGMWGLFVFAPLFANYVQIPLTTLVEGMPIVGTILYARVPSGVGMLTAGIILAIMIIPFIASITRDMLDQIPSILRESAYRLHHMGSGALRSAAPGRRQHHRRHHARPRPRPRRDHGGDLRHRQCEPPVPVALRPELDHRVPHRQRVQ
jgi:phosphate transport system permease protein